jgi:hypothetical protein
MTMCPVPRHNGTRIVPATEPPVSNLRFIALISASLGARSYMISEGTLDECIQQFLQLREAQRHLYEIHTAPQVGAILSTDHIVQLARLRDFLGK